MQQKTKGTLRTHVLAGGTQFVKTYPVGVAGAAEKRKAHDARMFLVGGTEAVKTYLVGLA